MAYATDMTYLLSSEQGARWERIKKAADVLRGLDLLWRPISQRLDLPPRVRAFGTRTTFGLRILAL
jgi:hypothetical protein